MEIKIIRSTEDEQSRFGVMNEVIRQICTEEAVNEW